MSLKYLNLALSAWREGEQLRRRRRRYKDYTYGRQWNDIPGASSGLTEGELAEQSGFKPLTNNLIRQLVKCVVGNFRASLAENDPAAERAAIDPDVERRNALSELDCRMLEEFLISGCAIQRIVTEKRMAGSGVWIDNVSPDSFFINRFSDPRGLDIELLGMLHSMSLRELLMRFAPEGGVRARHLTELYTTAASSGSGTTIPLGDEVARQFFEAPAGRCRVIELWTLESRAILRCNDTATGEYFIAPAASAPEIDSENKRRRQCGEPEVIFSQRASLRWHCRFLSPSGEVLKEHDSPYAHGMHPFVVKFYPLIDGEVHSLVEDIIDQQRYVNRLITLSDHIMSVSAKGALLVPSGCIPAGMSTNEFGRLWARCNSVIPYNPAKGEPKQITGSADNAGAYKLLDIQLQLFQQISGVSGALQGQIGDSRTSAALYDSQVHHSSVAILDLLQTFHSFRAARNELVNVL